MHKSFVAFRNIALMVDVTPDGLGSNPPPVRIPPETDRALAEMAQPGLATSPSLRVTIAIHPG